MGAQHQCPRRLGRVALVLFISLHFLIGPRSADGREPVATQDFFEAILDVTSEVTGITVRQALEPEYQKGIKHYLLMSGGLKLAVTAVVGVGQVNLPGDLKVCFLIDLDDYFGVTDEGKEQDWITVHIRVAGSAGWSALPADLGYKPIEIGRDVIFCPDIQLDVDTWFGGKLDIGGMKFKIIGWDQEGFAIKKVEQDPIVFNVKFSVAEALSRL
jgi:hypothetical protein